MGQRLAKFIFCAVMAFMFLAWAGPAVAQVANVPCVIVPNSAPKAAAEKHAEAPAFVGGTNTPQGLFQIGLYFNPNKGSFTLFLVNPKGGHCVLMVGDGAVIEYEAPGAGS